MRVTDSTLYARIQQGLAVRSRSLEEAQARAISGKRVVKPSDDAAASAQARMQTAQESRSTAHERTVNVASLALQVADAGLDQVNQGIERLRELALQAANGTSNAEDRAHAAAEVSALRDQLIGLANSQEGGRYVFGGYKDDQPPFLANGTYRGDTQAQSVEVTKNVHIPTGISGDRIFNPAGGQDMFAAIADLQGALESNDVSGIRATLNQLDDGARQVRLARTEIGGHMAATEVARAVVQRVKDQAVTSRARLVDADTIQSYSDLARAQAALEAAVAVAAQLPPPGLASRARVG